MMGLFRMVFTAMVLFLLTFPIESFAQNTTASPIPGYSSSESSATNPDSKPEFEDEFAEFESYGKELKIHDPFEETNRQIYEFNDAFDRHFFRHVALYYRKIFPNPVRRVVYNFISNLYVPISLFNSIIQGKVDNSLATFSHFLINSTLGIGGLFDVAGHKNVRYNNEDFGQTLGHYGLGSGVYIIIPFLGPSSTRDLAGLVVDKSINPMEFGLIEIAGHERLLPADYRTGTSIISAVDKRERLLDLVDDIKKDSFDPYATIRSAYLQKRANEVEN